MRIKWSLEEAVVLLEYFFVSRGEYKDSELQTIRNMMIKAFYSKEMIDLIDEMTEKNKEKRKTSKYFLEDVRCASKAYRALCLLETLCFISHPPKNS